MQSARYQILNKAYPRDKNKLRCALSWKSVKGLKSDHKSMPLNSLLKILQIEDIDFFNIQYSDEQEEINALKENHNISLEKPEGIDTYKDIYGLMDFIDSCDFVITTSNTNAHLAGALGKKTYLLLPNAYGKLWYWDNEHNGTNVWYPSIQKFEQKEIGDWTGPVDEVYDIVIKI